MSNKWQITVEKKQQVVASTAEALAAIKKLNRDTEKSLARIKRLSIKLRRIGNGHRI